MISFPIYTSMALPYDYAYCVGLDDKVSEVASVHIINPSDSSLAFETIQANAKELNCPATEEQENELTVKAISLVVKIIAALSAMPEYVEHGAISRPGKVKRGKQVQSELWHPNVIGRQYAARLEASRGGTHASPRMHKRRGHMRWQPYGEGRAQRKLLWIEEVWVG